MYKEFLHFIKKKTTTEMDKKLGYFMKEEL